MTKPNKTIEGFSKNSTTKIKGTVGIWQGRDFIDIREYVDSAEYKGKTKKGIHFSLEDWEKFKDLISKIDKEVKERTKE